MKSKRVKTIANFCRFRSFRELFIVASIFLFGFFFFLWIFLRSRLVPMIDGPYYLIQVRSILRTRGLEVF